MAVTADGGVAIPRISDLLRTPDDLEKLTNLKADVARKKADVDARLREGLSQHLETTQNGMSTLAEGQKLVGQIKDEMKSIHDLCEQAQAIRKDFPQIDYLARVHRNFEATRAMQAGLDSFERDCNEVLDLLEADEQDEQNQPNLLQAHMKITRLRDFRDEALDQISKANDESLRNTLEEWFAPLDRAIETFDGHVGVICMDVLNLVQQGNDGLVVRLALVLHAEEKNDERVQALLDAQKDHQDLVSKFTSFTIGPKSIRGYKEKFLKAVELVVQQKFQDIQEAFSEDPEKLVKLTKWYFNDLNAVKLGMQKLFPKKWKILKTYTTIYHRTMHDFLLSYADSQDISPPQMLGIIHYIDPYYERMSKLGISKDDLTPHVLDNREGDMVREYRNLITQALTQWIDRMQVTDRKNFISKSTDAIEQDAQGHFRTKTLGDMWRMLHEQTELASSSQREDVVEGVMSSMCSVLKSRQQQWERLIADEVDKYRNPTPELMEHLQPLQEYLLAIANDQIACVDDSPDMVNDITAQAGYLTRFRDHFFNLATPPSARYQSTNATTEVEALRDGYVDLATHTMAAFVRLIFMVDFKTVTSDLFLPSKWYQERAMEQIISTFDDYISDYHAVIHPSLQDILITEIADNLLIAYLTSITRNRGVKFRRQDPFPARFRDDVLPAFEFFQKQNQDVFNEHIKPSWKAVSYTVQLLESDKAAVPSVYESFKRDFWDLQLSWVEAVIKTRDEWDRNMINAVKRAAAGTYGDRGLETIMGKVTAK
ncbi:SNARE-binding exocyst subunit S6 [Exophiala xenobiotica]|uniref:SNARE-binding exocyst subunit S6 n=1 Tax=Lithohypha guttulata TaxID=1690604 RepID=A0ABR0JZF8_9EURO|nr:SNARE-binding exocyst subunit S6 [Lithohypha guttulata]KAK5311434.1 SNARE-binding exocyst subunit S6 [Exophiala xenobiotica]